MEKIQWYKTGLEETDGCCLCFIWGEIDAEWLLAFRYVLDIWDVAGMPQVGLRFLQINSVWLEENGERKGRALKIKISPFCYYYYCVNFFQRINWILF